MAKSKSRWFRKIIMAAGGSALLLVCGGVLLTRYATPTVRKEINSPLFTVGDANYAAALSEGKNIVKFGRLPFGIYPGGMAFSDATEAQEYIEESGKIDAGWQVYRLSGDFEKDTVLSGERRYTKRSLLVLEMAPEAAAPSLDYAAFDQTPGSGWRAFADQGKYTEAALSLESYLAANPELGEREKSALNFHAGQMHAYANDYQRAKHRFESSLIDSEPADSPIKWNAYVNATLAFIAGDEATLLKCRQEISNGPKMGDMTPNLDVVEELHRHLGQPYSVAYESSRGMVKR